MTAGFDHEGFYKELISFLGSGDQEIFTVEVLCWWNEYVLDSLKRSLLD